MQVHVMTPWAQTWNDFADYVTYSEVKCFLRSQAIIFFTHNEEDWKYSTFLKSDKISLAAMLKIISQTYEKYFFDFCSIITESDEFLVSVFFLHNSVDKNIYQQPKQQIRQKLFEIAQK